MKKNKGRHLNNDLLKRKGDIDTKKINWMKHI
jgi:hypothetical protein